MTLKNDLLLRSIKKEAIERTPAWLMRQAGRYLPEYMQTRSLAKDFLTLCKTPELALEVTLQPLRRYPLDAAIVFSDILTIPDAMGLGLHFVENHGPQFANPINSKNCIDKLLNIEIEHNLEYVMQAIRLMHNELKDNLPLIGFAGSPWTLACYMLEGRSSKTFKKALKFMYEEPQAMHVLLDLLAMHVSEYLCRQVEAGVDVLMIFDTWGGLLSPICFEKFSCDYLNKIVKKVKSVHPTIPIILFAKGGSNCINMLADTSCDVVGLDWTCDLKFAREQIGAKVALQGNLDPIILLTDKTCIWQEVERTLASYGKGSGHIFNLGHGITPDVSPDRVLDMLEAVAALSKAYHH